MKIPEDWDHPGRENEKLCGRFSAKEHVGHFTIPFRLYEPEKRKGWIPLVVFLHGADAVGRDNGKQLSMHEIGTMFARDEWQAQHPCYILAPQYNYGMHWSTAGVTEDVFAMIGECVRAHPLIDKSRIYIYGYSAGGVGTLRMLKEYPDFFAGAIAICGATGDNDLANLLATPLYLIHAADDEIVRASYRSPKTHMLAHYGSRDIYEELQMKAGSLHYIEYPEGDMKAKFGVNPHCVWVAVSAESGEPVREWLFAKTRRR